ncbi:hypothetical protein D3C84_743940 [compost metagenome]
MFAVDFRQPVDRFVQQLWCTVRLAIPLGPFIGILQTEVCRQVDDLGASGQQLARQGMGDTVRGSEEHHVTGSQGLHVRHTEGQTVVVTAQVRVHIGNRQAGFGARGDHRHLGLWMLCQQTQQLDSGVTRAANDTDLDHNACPFSTNQQESPR